MRQYAVMSEESDATMADAACRLAAILQERAAELQTAAERRQQAELDRMLQTARDKATLIQLTDQAFRSRRAARTAEHLTHILDAQGVPRFFNPLDRALMRGFQTFGNWLPGVSVPMVKAHMRQETANVVLPAERELLAEHLRARQRGGVRMNLNLLGEALLGEEEAQRRLEKYLAALQLPEVEVLSVKISTLCSQIAPQAREHTLRVLGERLELLYREARHLRFRRADGTETPKFVYLDMEEYRDLELTAEVFMRTLDRPGLEDCAAGIALQAYIPDSARAQRRLLAWARQRVARGGAAVTIRLVKGANLEAERVEASLRGWPQAPYKTKLETDANYKRMLRFALRPENLAAARVGIASHNLFDLAYGLLLAAAAEAGGRVQFEMLEGMANHQRRALLEHTRHLLLYAPACEKGEFLNAIGYLLRRLDENTGPENFLRHAYRLQPGSADWRRLEAGFRAAFAAEAPDTPRRTQDRASERHDEALPEGPWHAFQNEPDTDFSLPGNARWAEGIAAAALALKAGRLPLVIAGEEAAGVAWKPCLDPSRPGVVLAEYSEAGGADVERAIACARADPAGWRSLSVDARNAVLGRAARELRRARAVLMTAAMANGGKTLLESDPECSEAVDFVEFYRASARALCELPNARAAPRGVVVVAPPWNFPIAIPCGGVAAALAAGNTVILKPASATVLPAWELCQCFWRAGVPRAALQFAPCAGSGAGARLATHPEVDAVILTGGTETAQRLLRARPELRLFAETGGKNASLITALSDRELAVKHVVQSAFGHAGQKCSATSLLLLEAEVYDDPAFQRMLVDAARSLPVGPAQELSARVGPLITPPAGALEEGLKTLEPGESWALMPHESADNPRLWSPGIKYGVTPGSVTHLTEFFGPLLGVMRFETLEEAIEIVNATGYGLTSALHSLDEREHALWQARLRAGNLYLNRGTTGALVLRQPFGGMGRSSFGPGMKAGGPHYVAQFLRFEDAAAAGEPAEPEHEALAELARRLRSAEAEVEARELARLRAALADYDRWWREAFSQEHDHQRLLGQDNLRRYLPFREIRLRVVAGDGFFDIAARAAAARVTGARVIVSAAPGVAEREIALLDRLTDGWAAGIEFVEESDAELEEHVRALPPLAEERIRFAAPERVPAPLRAAAAVSGAWLAAEPVLACGRIELLWYLREQSLCFDYHRYGNLGARQDEPRAEPL